MRMRQDMHEDSKIEERCGRCDRFKVGVGLHSALSSLLFAISEGQTES